MATPEIETEIRIEQEWARREVMADHLNRQRYSAYYWRRDLRHLDWQLGDLSWRVAYWIEPRHEVHFALEWDKLPAYPKVSRRQGLSIQRGRALAVLACSYLVRGFSQGLTNYIQDR